VQQTKKYNVNTFNHYFKKFGSLEIILLFMFTPTSGVLEVA